MPQALTIEQAEASFISPYREPTQEPEADIAAFMAGCAKTRLYGVQGAEQSGDHKGAYRDLWFAENYLRQALKHVEQAKARLSMDYGLDDSEFGLIPVEPVATPVLLERAVA